MNANYYIKYLKRNSKNNNITTVATHHPHLLTTHIFPHLSYNNVDNYMNTYSKDRYSTVNKVFISETFTCKLSDIFFTSSGFILPI